MTAPLPVYTFAAMSLAAALADASETNRTGTCCSSIEEIELFETSDCPDLLTTSWLTVDHRLRTIERKLEQMERSPEELSAIS